MSKHSNRSFGLTVLRVVVGIVFMMHGGQKLFALGVPAVAGFFGHAGIPFPRFFSIFITLLELLGGVALILGVATRAFAALFAIEMAVAVLKVHLKSGFFIPGFEYPLTLFAASLCLVLTGAGAASIDGALSKGAKDEASVAD